MTVNFKPKAFFCVILISLFSGSCLQSDQAGSLKPEGYESENMLTVEEGDLKAVFVDNTAFPPDHRAGYNGIAQLYHVRQDSGIFVPAFAGFNLEHIFGGDSLHQLFEPRLHPMSLFRKSENEVVLYQGPTPLSAVESLTSFKVVAPHYIDVTFECVLHDLDFFAHDYAGMFWASYIQNPADRKIYFRGMDDHDTQPRWVGAWSEEHGVSSTHRSVDDDHDFFFAGNFNARLANHFSEYRFTEPFFFGRYGDMMLGFMFDAAEVIRFSQSPTGGGRLNPAWDFQYLIASPREGRKYGFKARMVYKPFISETDMAEEYKRWKP